jgi:2-polyprenyl-6-methoxyphenol hydroxylase-like FAD-dependent oxidoreductase
MPTKTITTRCCIAGGGPAGMMLGFLLARAGVDVVVLEKHADFFRDFRGDTIHPSTLEIMYELGLLKNFLKRPHQDLQKVGVQIGDKRVIVADFTHVPTHCHFITLMPQWDFLDFLAEHARQYGSFHLHMLADVDDLLFEGKKIVGVRARTQDGALEIRADLVVGADGRHSTVRERAGLEVEDFGAPMDALWMRLSKWPEDDTQTLGHVLPGRIFVMFDRGDYWQCAYVIPKGAFDELRHKGLSGFRSSIVEINPAFASRVQEIASWDDIKLLSVTVDHLKHWCRPGLLCIGDAAHAMSPVGGVGINLAIQDAVAAANILAIPLRQGPVPENLLAAVQRRREWPTKVTQTAQVFIQRRIISNVLRLQSQPTVPFVVKLLNWFPVLRRIPARLVGVGFRPEHVHSPDVRSDISRPFRSGANR